MEFYTPAPTDERTLKQGDLLANVPFTYFYLASASVILTNHRSATRDLSTVQPEDVTAVRAPVEFSWGIVLSQSCDVQPVPETGAARRPIVIARVRPIAALVPKPNFSTPKAAVAEVRKLANPGAAPSIFYLPAITARDFTLERSGANLLDTQRFLPGDLPPLTSLLRLRLTAPALQALQERCAYCYGRFGAPDDLYYSPEESQYLQG